MGEEEVDGGFVAGEGQGGEEGVAEVAVAGLFVGGDEGAGGGFGAEVGDGEGGFGTGFIGGFGIEETGGPGEGCRAFEVEDARVTGAEELGGSGGELGAELEEEGGGIGADLFDGAGGVDLDGEVDVGEERGEEVEDLVRRHASAGDEGEGGLAAKRAGGVGLAAPGGFELVVLDAGEEGFGFLVVKGGEGFDEGVFRPALGVGGGRILHKAGKGLDEIGGELAVVVLAGDAGGFGDEEIGFVGEGLAQGGEGFRWGFVAEGFQTGEVGVEGFGHGVGLPGFAWNQRQDDCGGGYQEQQNQNPDEHPSLQAGGLPLGFKAELLVLESLFVVFDVKSLEIADLSQECDGLLVFHDVLLSLAGRTIVEERRVQRQSQISFGDDNKRTTRVMQEDGGSGAGVGVEGLEAADALFGFAAVGLLAGLLPAGGFALLAELDDDAVAAAEDVEVLVDEAVVALGLRGEPGDLAADGGERGVGEELAGAESGAVEDGALGELGEVGGGGESTGFELAAGKEEVFGELVDEVGDVEHELGVAAGVAGGERVGAGGEVE